MSYNKKVTPERREYLTAHGLAGTIAYYDSLERDAMPKDVTPVVDEAASIAGYDPAAFEWDIVHEEAPDQIVFDTVGDEYVGLYLGAQVISFEDKKGEQQTFTQLRFRDPNGLTVVNAGYELREAFAAISAYTMVKIKLMKLVDVGQNDPMKSFRIWSARSAADQTH